MRSSDGGSLQADPTEGGQAAYIPRRFLTDFIDFLAAHPDKVEIITYDDLPWGDDHDAAGAYPSERLRWEAQIRAGDRDPSKIHVLLQHDVDTRPERSMAVLRHELVRGVRSNLMIFVRRVDRRHLRSTGELRFTPYELDEALLQRASHAGCVIAYHQNAFEQARFDERRAQTIFSEDVRRLAQRFAIRYTCAHGGTPAPDGRNNLHVAMPSDLVGQVRWVYNGFSPWFAGTYSDGGINSPKRDPEKRDLRAFVRSWQPGKRYRVLTHPQYYAPNPAVSPRLAGAGWYEEIRRHYRDPEATSVWDEVARDLFATAGCRSGASDERTAANAAPCPPEPRSTPCGPIFVRGLSRSGGTLMATILDAHPDVAMSYELYPSLLSSCDVADGPSLTAIIRILVAAPSLNAAAKAASDRGLRVFLARCGRGGLDRDDLCELLEEHRAAGLDLGTPENRLRFIERCCTAKMRRAGKRRWGVKCTSHYDLYRQAFPNAYFLNMLRDGRDVLASQLHVGAFNKPAPALARGWVETHERFRALLEDPAVNAYMVRYEALAAAPEVEVRRICAFLGLAFEAAMLRFHEHDLTIYKSSHLSMEQISQPITPAKVGRWKRDLPIDALLEFEAVAGPALRRFGYEVSTDADRSARNPDHLPRPTAERAQPPSLAATLRQHLGGLLRR